MNRPVACLLAACAIGLSAAALLLAQDSKAQPKRVALLVGINAYQKRGFPDLDWAENDVEELKQELLGLGFDKVVVMKGGAQGELAPTTPERILAQLEHLLVDVAKNDVVLVALCGHGQQLRVKGNDGKEHDDGFYCPVNAVLNDPKTMLSLSRLTDKVLQERGGKNLVLVDACRDGVVDVNRGVRSRGIEGRVVSLPENTAILFSCAAGQTSLERKDLKHGVFTLGVLQTMRTVTGTNGSLTWGALVDGVQNRVSELNPGQEPIAAGAIGLVSLGRRVVVGGRASQGTRAGEERDDNGLKMKLCWCPPGSIRMGSPSNEPDRRVDEGPVNVTLSRGFWMGKYEVTQEQWQRVMSTTIRKQADKAGTDKTYGESPNHPMYYVSAEEADEFCRRLTESERRAGRLPAGWSYQLPTEAQWEYACRAGTTTATAFGDRLGSQDANFDGNYPYNGASKGPYLQSTAAVGSYRANTWGLHDMHGNVWEWCLDGYGERLPGGVDPMGPLQASSRVFRGGGWSGLGWGCRSANRRRLAPGYRDFYLGFRVARVPSSS